jgi:WD40 repeat protein
VARADNSVRFWNAETGEQHLAQDLKHDQEVMTVVFGSGHNFAVTNSAERVGRGRPETLVEDATVRFWNAGNRDRRQIYELVHDRGVLSASFGPSGERLLTSAGNAARLWDVRTGEIQFTLSHDNIVTTALFGPDERFVITASKDKTARLWAVETGAQQFLIRHEHPVQHAWLIANGKLVVTIADRTLRVWGSRTGTANTGSELFAIHLGKSGGIRSDSFSPDGKFLVMVSEKTAQVWDVEKRVKRFSLEHKGRVRTAAFTADSRLLVTRSDENIARAWDMKSGETKFTFGQPANAREVLVSPNGRSIMTLTNNRTAILWDLETGDERFTLEHNEGVRFVQFIAAGRLVVSGSFCDFDNNCEMKVWDVETGEENAALGFRTPTSFWQDLVGFSQNGKLMFTMFGNNAHMHKETLVRVWDLETVEERFDKPFRSDKRLETVDFSPDSERLVIKYGNKVLMLAVSGELLQSAIAAATTVCLKPEFRRQNLGESDARAHENWKACELKYGRE